MYLASLMFLPYVMMKKWTQFLTGMADETHAHPRDPLAGGSAASPMALNTAAQSFSDAGVPALSKNGMRSPLV